MKKNYYLTLIFVASFSCLIAQTTVTSGPYTLISSSELSIPPPPKGKKWASSITFPDGILEIYAEYARSWNFRWLTSDGNSLVKENTVDVSAKLEGVNFWGFLQLKNKIYGIGTKKFKDTKQEGPTVLEVDPKAMNDKGDAVTIFKTSSKLDLPKYFHGGAGLYNPQWYGVDICKDKTKFACIYELANKEKNDKKNKKVIGVQVLDENLVNLWGNEFEMELVEAKMEIRDYELLNDGRFCITTKVYDDEKKSKFHYELLLFNKGTTTPQKIEIRLENDYVGEMELFYSKDGKLMGKGIYGKADKKGALGVYFLSIDLEKLSASTIGGGYYEFPPNIQGVENLGLSTFHEAPDGSTKILSEVYFYETDILGGSNPVAHYYDIIIISVRNGKTEWAQRIPKRQINTGSFSDALVGNDLHIFWKDKAENSSLKEGQVHEKFVGNLGVLRGCWINSKGEMKKYDIADVSNYLGKNIPAASFSQIDNTTLVFNGSRQTFRLEIKP